MRRSFCLPLVGGDVLTVMASRLLMRLGGRLSTAGHAVTYCLCRTDSAPDIVFPVEEARKVAAGHGAAVAEVPVSVEVETAPRIGPGLSLHLDRFLTHRPCTDVVVPGAFGVGFYPLQAKRLGLRHRATAFSLLHLGVRRELMADRAVYPSLEDVAAFHREERCFELADRILAVSPHQLEELDPDRAELVPVWDLDDGTAVDGPAPDYLVLTGFPGAEDVGVAARGLALALAGGPELPRIELLQWGQPHTAAQVEEVFRALCGRRVDVSFDWFIEGNRTPRLAAAGVVIVPAVGTDAGVMLELAVLSGARIVAQDHPALRHWMRASGIPVYTRDHRTLARVLASGAGSVIGMPGGTGASTVFTRSREGDSVPLSAPATATGQPLVSVCMTMFNRTRYLPAALESIRRQTWERLEVLLCDDGSTEDEALAFLDEVELQPPVAEFRVLRQDHHSLGRNRNQALAAARGDYILFVDDDNVARPREIETLLAAAQRTGADAVSCFCEVFADDSVLTEAAPPLAIRPFSGDDVSIGSIHNCLGDANAFYPRRTFETFGQILEEPERGYEDWEYLLRIALCGGRIEVVPDALYWYRVNPGSMTATLSMAGNNMIALRPLLYPAEHWPAEHATRRQQVLADLAWVVKGARIRAVDL